MTKKKKLLIFLFLLLGFSGCSNLTLEEELLASLVKEAKEYNLPFPGEDSEPVLRKIDSGMSHEITFYSKASKFHWLGFDKDRRIFDEPNHNLKYYDERDLEDLWPISNTYEELPVFTDLALAIQCYERGYNKLALAFLKRSDERRPEPHNLNYLLRPKGHHKALAQMAWNTWGNAFVFYPEKRAHLIKELKKLSALNYGLDTAAHKNLIKDMEMSLSAPVKRGSEYEELINGLINLDYEAFHELRKLGKKAVPTLIMHIDNFRLIGDFSDLHGGLMWHNRVSDLVGILLNRLYGTNRNDFNFDFLYKEGRGMCLDKSHVEYWWKQRNTDVTSVLIKGGAQFDFDDLVSLNNIKEVERVLKNKPWLAKNYGALEAAIQNENIPMIELLIKYGADPDFTTGGQNLYGRLTPLSEAFSQEKININIVKLLLKKGARPSASWFVGKLESPLICNAVRKKDTALLKLLLEHGAEVHTWNDWVRTPLHVAALFNDKEKTEILLNHKAEINAHFGTGKTPLFYAALKGHKDLAKYLISKGARQDFYTDCLLGMEDEVNKAIKESPSLINTLDKRLEVDALYYAVLTRNKVLAEILIKAGAEVNKRYPKIEISENDVSAYEDKDTVLHLASRHGYHAIVELLMKNGADINVP
jgi:ankyrin repeat protein